MNKISSVAYFSFKDLAKGKVFYITLALGACVVMLTMLSFHLSYGDPGRVAVNVGFGLASISSIVLGSLMGINLIASEIETKTIFTILTKPLSRSEFYIGKILGLFFILFLNLSLIIFISYFTIKALGTDIDSFFIHAALALLLEVTIVVFLVSILSMLLSKPLALFSFIILYISGHSINFLQTSKFVKENELLENILAFYYFILPDFSKINLKEYLVYPHQAYDINLLHVYGYGLSYAMFLALLGIMIFKKKELE